MKILRRNYEHRNLIIFLVFSMIYLQAIYSLSRGESVLNLKALKTFFFNHYLILAVNLITIFMVAKLKKHSDKILSIFLVLIVSKNFIMLASSFNKLILGLNFIYLVFAFYFFVTWELEIAKASYNPQFSEHDLEKDTRFPINGKMENLKTGEIFDVMVTNVDEESCFVLLTVESRDQFKADAGATYRLTVSYENVLFVHNARLASKYHRGLGLEFIQTPKSDFPLNWSDLHQVCLERGLFN